MMCFVGFSYGQDTIVLNTNERIPTRIICMHTIPTHNGNSWMTGYYYTDLNNKIHYVSIMEVKELIIGRKSKIYKSTRKLRRFKINHIFKGKN